MSVRFDASGDQYTATTGLPGTTFAALWWARVAVDRNAYSTFVSIDNGTSQVLAIQTDADGVSPYLWLAPHGTEILDATPDVVMTVGSWYRFAIVRSGTAVTLYLAAATGTVSTGTATLTGTLTPATLRVAQSPTSGEWLNGNIANLKVYTAALTQTEIETEWASWSAQRTANLLRHHTWRTAAETTDYSGNNNTLTSAGTPTFESTNPSIAAVVSGTAAATLGGLSATAAGSRTVLGGGNTGPTGGLTAGASATRTVQSFAAATLGGLDGAGVGVRTVLGGGTADVGGITAAAQSTSTVIGFAAMALGGLAATASAQRTVWGGATTDLGGLTAVAVGVLTVDGQGVATADLGGLTVTATAVRDVPGLAAAELGGLVVVATGARSLAGSGSALLGGLAASASGQRTVAATLAATLAGLAATAAGLRVPGSGSSALHDADDVRVGSAVVTAVYLGSTLVWSLPGAGFATATLGGLTAVAAGLRTVRAIAAAATGGLTATANGLRGTGGSPTGGSGGPLTDRTSVSYSNGTKNSTYHIYADGLDWSKRVGVLVYGDGSGEFGLANPSNTYLLAGANGLVAVAKEHNMVLVTPRAPGNGCTDGDGVCWYLPSNDGTTRAQKTKWLDDLIKTQVLPLYNIDKTRVCIAGFSSGAENAAGIYGPAHAASWMEDGLLLAISYGSSPDQYGVTDTYTAAFRANVAVVWDVYADDETTAVADSLEGYQWYAAEGFTTLERNVIPGGQHDRPGEFGGIVDQYITEHVAATGGGGSTGFDFAFGMNVEDIQSLPNSGTPWNNLKSLADRTFTFDSGSGSVDDCSSAFAAGLVYVRNNDTAYRDKVNNFLDAIQATDESTWYYQVPNRKMSMIALAGQLVGRTSTSWLTWLGNMRYQQVTGHSRSPNLHRCAWDWGNNHGAGARMSHITIDAVIGDMSSTAPDGNPSGLANAVKWYKASLGDKTDYGCWADDRQQYGGLGKTGSEFSNSWTVSSSDWAPVNQSTAVFGSTVSLSKDGVLCQEAYRDDTSYSVDVNGRPIFGSSATTYHYEAGGYLLATAIVLAANGYPEVWTWADSAVHRWRAACARWNYPPNFSTYSWIDHVFNKVYGASYTTSTPVRANAFAASDWLALHPNWPVTV